MLPKKNRLTKKRDFDAVFAGGKSVRGGFLAVKFQENGLADSRFGFVVSKKISNKATVRNKVKRRLRDIVARLAIAPKNPSDFIFLTMPGIEKREFSEVQEAVAMLFKKIS